jgi:tetraacyldisaccharide 4'-kinase
LNQEIYRKLISGQSTGVNATFLRFFLFLVAFGYSLVIRLRNFLYAKGWLKAYKVNAIVFSIGNITAGGTGKTPLVIWLCNLLRQKNASCAILTRGYKTNNQRPTTSDEQRAMGTDEPAIFAENCPQAKVIVNPDRVAGAAEAINKFGAKVLILDDGFQHRQLARDLDIVTIDTMLPFGYDKLLPAGLLREPVTALKRADAAIITRCNQTTEAKLAELEQKLQQINPNMIIARSIHAPVYAKSPENREISLEKLKSKKIFAFCGIGNPNAFLKTINSLGYKLVGSKIYNDHHHYTENDIADIHNQAKHLEADLILTTQKDWASMHYAIRTKHYEPPFAYLAIELKFLTGEDKLKSLIDKTLPDKILTK